MKHILKLSGNTFSLVLLISSLAFSKPAERYFYQFKIYHLKTQKQAERVENYLKNAYLPALHKAGIKNVGVFKPAKPDTLEQLIYVFIPFKSLDQFSKIESVLLKDQQYLSAGKDYIDAAYNDIPYSRIESILIKSFQNMPYPAKSKLTDSKNDRIYELRSYEGHTEKIYANKVEMFNKGGEIKLFDRLGFNALFYGEVLIGSKMPNLMYMTSFNNMKERDEHWKAFVDDSEWKKLSGMAEYKNNVSHSDTYFLKATEYSDL